MVRDDLQVQLYLVLWVRVRVKILGSVNSNPKHIYNPNPTLIDDFRGACAVKGNGAVAGHVKRVDHDDVFDALLFREETLTRHYFILKFDFSWGIRTNMGKTEGIFLNLQCNCHIQWCSRVYNFKTDQSPYNFSTWLPDLTVLMPL